MNKKQVFVSLTWLWLKGCDENGDLWYPANAIAAICTTLAGYMSGFPYMLLSNALGLKLYEKHFFLYIVVFLALHLVFRLLVCLFFRLRNTIIRHKRKASEQDPT